VAFVNVEHGVGVLADDAGAAFLADLFVRDQVWAPFTPAGSRAGEDKVLADPGEFVLPEGFRVEDVGRIDLGGNSACQVFDCFPRETLGGVVDRPSLNQVLTQSARRIWRRSLHEL
jgi:hypothetical protein